MEGRGFVRAENLKVGDRLRLAFGKEAAIEEVWEEALDEEISVYNFEVADFHTYFVSELGVLVHNSCGASGRPYQVHHFATNKNKRYTHQLKEIADKYGLDLNGDWNKAPMPHQGRHPNAYHRYVLNNMQRYDRMANGNKAKFLELYERMKQKIKANPDILRKNYWKGR